MSNLGYSLAKTEEIQQAFAALDRAENLDPDAIFVRYLLDSSHAITHFHDDDWIQGVHLAQKAVKDNPGIIWLQVFLTNGLGLLGNQDAAREQWQLIIARFPGLTVQRYRWYLENSMSTAKAQCFVEGLVLAGVESGY